jgi:hypothetical protein
VSEWSIELVLKTSRGDEPLVGSNPTSTAIKTEQNTMQNTIAEWTAHEFQHREKGPGWYLTLAIITILIVGYLIIQHDYFAALTLFVAAVVIGYGASLYPDEVLIQITDEGIHIGESFIPYHNIRRFWLVDHPEAREIHLETTAYFNRHAIIQLADQEPRDIRRILRQHITETQPNYEKVSHRIGRKLRF